MAEWKTDTEEVRQIVKACRDFKRSLQEERCAQFIKNLDSYVREILLERRKIEHQLQDAIEKLRRAKKKRSSFWGFFVECARDLFDMAGEVIQPAKLGVAVCDEALNLMEENTEKYEKNVRLLEQVLEIYSIQTKASVELVEGAWESVKKSLDFYTDKHQEFIKRLNQASEAIDNEYNIAPPEILKESDFESPTIVYSPKKSVYDECLKDLREDFSFSLYADLKNRINASSKSDRATNSKEHELDLMNVDIESLTLAKKNCAKNIKEALEGFTKKIKESPNDSNAINEAFDNLETELERATENLSQKIDPVLERNENYTQKSLEYREFLESRKEDFIVDEKTPYPEEVRFNESRLAEFDSVFSAIAPLEDLNKTACAHHALKALQAALKNRDLGFDAAELEQIAKGFIPKGYLWHFDANVLGNVALVREELLLGVKHTKGYSLWTEFLQKQN
ncbi:HNH endonuclease [Helicobacter pylori]|uniref:HNH endonuclease signature motif containing protein n=1 Tax=Helicobacter pylori TaxID=210 RepID=UPI0029288A7E|nr:HNH endonuclease [Helicobacter pylori]MDU9719507.1 HNH endonuclease [Helicobacter pylori]